MNKKLLFFNGILISGTILPALVITSCSSNKISERMHQINERFINEVEKRSKNFLPEKAEQFAINIKSAFTNYKPSTNIGTIINSAEAQNFGLDVLIKYTHIFGIDSENEKDPNGIREKYSSEHIFKLGLPVTPDAIKFFDLTIPKLLENLNKWNQFFLNFEFKIVDTESKEYEDLTSSWGSSSKDNLKQFALFWNEIFSKESNENISNLIQSSIDIFSKINLNKLSKLTSDQRKNILDLKKFNEAITKLSRLYESVDIFSKVEEFNKLFLKLKVDDSFSIDWKKFSIYNEILYLEKIDSKLKVSDLLVIVLNSNEEVKTTPKS